MEDDTETADKDLLDALTGQIVRELGVYERLAGYDAFEIMKALIAAAHNHVLDNESPAVAINCFSTTKARFEEYIAHERAIVRAWAKEQQAKKQAVQESGAP